MHDIFFFNFVIVVATKPNDHIRVVKNFIFRTHIHAYIYGQLKPYIHTNIHYRCQQIYGTTPAIHPYKQIKKKIFFFLQKKRKKKFKIICKKNINENQAYGAYNGYKPLGKIMLPKKIKKKMEKMRKKKVILKLN